MIGTGSVAEPIERRASLPVRKKTGMQQRKFVVGAVVILLAVGYLIFNSMQDTMMYFLEVSELMNKGDAAYGQQVRLGGKVLEGSVQTEAKTMVMRFTLTDMNDVARQVPVVYKGVVPDSFKPGGDVVLEGKLTPSGVFEASTLLAKCPSKYAPEG